MQPDKDTLAKTEHFASADLVSATAHPHQLQRYVIERPLGSGGFGIVYLAYDPQLDRPVALKVPKRSRFRTPKDVADFVHEARTAAKLKHESFVAVYDVQEEAGLPFIVQEYVDAGNLAVWAAEQKPPFTQIAQIMAGVASALGYLHQQGLTHCDLKLTNVLMDSNGKPHVADFGLTVHEDALRGRKGQVSGTPAMMAPEQVRGEAHRLDGRTDIWAVGVMLYELLVGRHPFMAQGSQAELFDAVKRHDPRPPRQFDRSVPRELERICLKCLAKRRTERYQTADDLRDDLTAWLSQIDSAVVPLAPTTCLKLCRRRLHRLVQVSATNQDYSEGTAFV